ncbi:MAG TPA: MG2 domain-containing protein [Steroidobacteraceae bacterium]|nr:MG2 domain-containing protein [Steroidobacteraceae bacterium]
MIRRLVTACATAVVFFLVACSGSNKDAPTTKPGAPDPSWVSAIGMHSNGAISRHSPLRVLFTKDVVPDAKVGGDASANIEMEPAAKVRISFVNRREIVIRPETEFAPNTEYRVKVKPKGLEGMAADTRPFSFSVKTFEVNFDVKNHGLDVDYEHEELMTLRGSIDTADTENREKLEKILTATLDGKPVRIQWTGGERQYGFVIPDIPRKKDEQQLVLSWDGSPLGLPHVKGTGTTRVPALDEFAVTQAEALQVNDQRQIQLKFSAAIDARQDLKGLVRLSSGEFTTSIQGNLLTLYVNENVVGNLTVTLEPQVRSRAGSQLIGTREFELEFTNTKPQVRFVGNGVILPDATTLSVPFEAVSARAVQVTALQVFEPNIPQFLQVNTLSGSAELGRVGRVLWRKSIPLTAQVPGKWTRYNLDVTELMRKHPGGLFQLRLSLSPKDALYECAGQSPDSVDEPEPANAEDADGYYSEENGSAWNYYEEENYDGEVVWNERDDPCKPAYYRYGQNIRAQRNLLASNIGLIAKRGAKGKLLVVATALDSAKPMPGVTIDAISYQNQLLASGRTDSSGTLELDLRAQPFALIADDNGRKGYLKVAQGVALPTSHFDVGGETVVNGLKGYLYGDRGVWRPGDTLYLTFALQDRNRTLPANHPVTLELRNPRGQLVQTLTNTTPVGQFYAFEVRTAADAPTGDWNATALIGGATFGKTLKIETVMPNRLKIDLHFAESAAGNGNHDAPADSRAGGDVLASSPLRAQLSSQWLSGATAANLRANVEVRLSPGATHFKTFGDYVFDDPARGFSGAPITVFDGQLDEDGAATLEKDLDLPRDVPGMLNASFVTRVFERGGAFSINRETRTVAAFDRYVGLKMPKGDAARDMLLTDTKHVVDLATVDLRGKPVSIPRLKVTLYKVQWRWWWEQTGDSLAQYAQSESNSVVTQQTLSSKDGRAQWTFEVRYPEWGRYLVRACDLDGGHCTGRVFYIDWPSWAGAQRDQSGPAANILTLTSDKQEYKVGETAVVQLPEAAQGRALLTLENGSAILEHRWIEASAKEPGSRGATNRVSIPITAAMAPNVYVAVTMIQPHAGKTNDRPIRLYGVIPLKVTDPQTRLAPLVTSAAEWAPQSKANVTVSETSGRAMNYTLAVVDEGLLGLTNFRTPDLHGEFYQREALGILTWDLFDEVAGAYGGELDRLLALGGSDGAGHTNPDEAKSRFPPVVKFLGPFALKAGEKKAHTIELPQYVGAVRVMVVAGDGSAYGSADKSVFVRQALMILPTLPRVIGPEEQFSLPVSVFTADASIKNVHLEVQTDARFSAATPKTTIAFTRPEEKLGFLALKAGSQLGKGKIKVIATSGRFRAESDVWLEIRTPNAAASRFQRGVLEPGAAWKADLRSFGLEGTQSAQLEVSALPPIDLDTRLQYLIGYPHGCLEQTTSSVFPQLYLSALVKLDQNQRLQTENNVRAGIARLRSFQHSSGGFAYWPGVWDHDPSLDWRNDWGTTYAGHFLLEAEKLGYSLPGDMKAGWIRYQKSAAQRWSAGQVNELRGMADYRASLAEAARFAQAYRLYTLALAGQPEVGAMNRLRETTSMSLAERWLLASAYKLAGKPDVAKTLVDGKVQAFVFADANPYTFGSLLRDRAIVLQGLTLVGRPQDADKLLEDVAAQLASGDWYSTQSLAFALVAVAQTTGTRPFTGFSFDYSSPDGKGGKARLVTVQGASPLATVKLPPPTVAGTPLELKNTSDRKLYVAAAVRAIARSGEEDAAANGLAVDIRYTSADGDPVDVSKLPQGMDLIAQITIRNTSRRSVDNLALTQMFPGGWEIRNDRLENVDTAGERAGTDARGRFWWVPSEWRDRQRREAEYTDIRDDRVLRYFSLNADESIFFETRLNTAYLGRYYLPGVGVEAMYDANLYARQRGQWVEVVSPQK